MRRDGPLDEETRQTRRRLCVARRDRRRAGQHCRLQRARGLRRHGGRLYRLQKLQRRGRAPSSRRDGVPGGASTPSAGVVRERQLYRGQLRERIQGRKRETRKRRRQLRHSELPSQRRQAAGEGAEVLVSVLRQMRPVEGELEAARAEAHRRAAFRVPVLRARVRRQERPHAAPAHPHGRAALPLRGVRQVFRARGLPVQAPHHARAQHALIGTRRRPCQTRSYCERAD